MKTILVPVDLSGVTTEVIAFATKLARAFAADCWLLHVAQPHPDFVGIELADALHWQEIPVHERHQPFVDLVRQLELGAGRATPVLLQGPVVEIICETAQAIGADMIVLGSHGHTALYELLVGSVSEGVIRHARLPVTVVPAAGKAS